MINFPIVKLILQHNLLKI